MSRNGSGIYSLPTVYKAATGDLIVANQHNTPLEDIKDDLNAARPIVAGGTGASTASGARTALSVPSISDVQTGYVPKVASKTALSALDTASFKAAVVTEATREKLWMWKTGDFSTEEAADTDHVNYIAADGVSTSLGCWVAATGDGVTVRTISAGGTGADNASDARDNLGLGSAATSDSTDFATAAQGAKADDALPASNVIDEDDMASDSATKVPTQQSVNARINQKTPFALQSDADGATINSGVTHASTVGYATIDDGGGAVYAFTDTDPSMPGQWSPADGRFAEIVPAPRYRPSPFGILPEDDGAAALINDAMEWMSRRRGGGVLEFLPERYDINETVLMQYPGVSLLGMSSGWHSQINAGTNPNQWANQHSCFWQWDANTTGDKMLVIRPKNDTAVGTLNGVGFDGIVLEGNGVATHCLEILSVRNGWFPRIIASNAVTQNIHLGVVADGEISSSEPRDLQHSYFGTMLSRVWLANSLATPGILIDGDDDADVSLCRFDYIQYIHKNALGMQIKSSDTCDFGMINGFRISGGSGSGISIDGGSSVTDFPREHIFRYLQPGPGGVGIHPNTVAPERNVCLFYSTGNGSPAASIQEGCGFNVVRYSNGTSVSFGNEAAAVDIRRRDDTVTSGTVYDLIARAWDSAGNLDDMAGIRMHLLGNTSGSEAGAIYFKSRVSGTFDNRFRIHDAFELADGTDIISQTGGIKGGRFVASKTAAYTITAADNGTLFNNSGASAKVAFTLPTGVAGLRYGFMVTDSDGIDVVAPSGAAIRVGASVTSTARTATSTTAGDVLWLVCTSTTAWIAENPNSGTWTLT